MSHTSSAMQDEWETSVQADYERLEAFLNERGIVKWDDTVTAMLEWAAEMERVHSVLKQCNDNQANRLREQANGST